jgi:tRNA A-37 threonylcarbamoyl transferase component Bud32
MSDDRWQRVGALFDRALAAPPPEREAVVRASGEPPDIQEEVLALLRAHDESGGFLEPPAMLEPGAEVASYRIERVLGRGGMGIVYLARDLKLHRPVALKALPPHLFRDDRMRARLRQEARAAAALSHPSIAVVHALEEHGDQIFIVSEYVEGPTLRQELSGGAMPRDRALSIAGQIAGALNAAHDRGIVHRDLKPENVLLTSSGVKVVDFGLAQFDVAADDLASVSRLTEPGTLAGTPPYMSPEQLLGHATDARADQFAFGVLLYELLTGRHPFGTGALPTTIARVLQGELERGDIPDQFWAVISRATQKNPSDRFASMRELAATLATPVAPGTGNGTAGTRSTNGTNESSGSFGWWPLHQLIVALAYWFMIWPAWHVHKWTGPYGVLFFLATLTVVVIGANTRLHLWFTARAYPSELAEQRANVARLVRGADIGFALMMMATGLTIAGAHTGWGALFVSFGLGAAVAFLVIEPATARAAFRNV